MTLNALKEKSQMIAEAVEKLPPGTFETGSTSGEWFARRVKNRRIKNRTVSLGSLLTRT